MGAGLFRFASGWNILGPIGQGSVCVSEAPAGVKVYFDLSFMVWYVLGPLSIQISSALHLDASQRGLRLQNASSPTLINVSVTDARDFAFSSDFAITPTFTNLAGSGNGRDAFLFDGGTLPTSRRWSLVNMPYIFGASVTVPVGSTLTLDPGVVLKWATGQDLQVDGTLSASATAAGREAMNPAATKAALPTMNPEAESFHNFLSDTKADVASTSQKPASPCIEALVRPGTSTRPPQMAAAASG